MEQCGYDASNMKQSRVITVSLRNSQDTSSIMRSTSSDGTVLDTKEGV